MALRISMSSVPCSSSAGWLIGASPRLTRRAYRTSPRASRRAHGLHPIALRSHMKSVLLSLPTFGFVVATRAALAFGVGLLVSGRIPAARRRTGGRAPVVLGGGAERA